MVNMIHIQGIRFDERMDQADIDRIIACIDEPVSFDDYNTRLEHLVVGGTCPFKQPLTPLSYLSSTMDVDEINYARMLHNRLKENLWVTALDIESTKEARMMLYERIHEVTGRPRYEDSNMELSEIKRICMDEPEHPLVDIIDESGIARLEYVLNLREFDPYTESAGIPYVGKINFYDGNVSATIDDPHILEGLGLRLPFKDTSLRSILKTDEIIAYIDEKGYFFEKK